ncbi:Receptor-like protein 12 [Morella rubra]|uniref:Receptor-like protein 12 n=1 Tax=Morella rubra TaxID=262757 RepID=A0A6A1URS0_9ROSI|nr:Receptor-like protein 12 [Morella rubra]KAB1203109.1 Receptor-like protein 12 [Morella rubra]
MVATHTFTAIAHLLLLFSFCPLGAPYRQAIKPASATNSKTFRCSEVERKALLSLKESLLDPSGRLSSWVGEDCCKWIGVGCENRTQHVVKLDLKNPLPVAKFDFQYERREALNKSSLGGRISPSLLDLKNLSYLDLSLNNFGGNNIPEFLGSLQSLSYLNLSFSFFAGVIPPHLGNLSRLQYLDLDSYHLPRPKYIEYPHQAHDYSFVFSQGLKAKNLKWLAGFPSLKYLNLGHANLVKVPNWLEALNTLPSLEELHLSECGQVSLPNSISSFNFTKLSVLDLSLNNFNSSIPHWLSNMSGLSILNLANNSLRGAIPKALADLHSLQELDLSSNSFIEGPIPGGLGNLIHLRKLDLSSNHINGTIPSSFANLCNLQTFDLKMNDISGEINELVDGFSRCSNSVLESLALSGNRYLGGKLPCSIGALQKLQIIDLSNCSLQGSIPDSIGSLSFLQRLHLSANRMSGPIFKSIGNLSMLLEISLGGNSWEGVLTGADFQNLTRLKFLYLSRPSENSTLVLDVKPDWVPPFMLEYLILRHIRIGPSFPAWVQAQNELVDLSLVDAGISGRLPENIGELFPKLEIWL